MKLLEWSLARKIAGFKILGDVFWFDQRRNFGQSRENGAEKNWLEGVEQFREYLIKWWTYHLSRRQANEGEIDFIELLEQRFKRIFPDTRFLGTVEMRNSSDYPEERDFYFILESQGRRFDIAEVSSGEEAVFIMLYQAARLMIQNSIVLIDELELHLNPVEQVRLLKNLPLLFPDCQFILTTHSPFVAEFFDETNSVRLENGRVRA